MEKHKHFKIKGFWGFLLEAEIHAVPNTWEKWIFIGRQKYGKIQAFQIYGFLNYFGWSRNPYDSQNMGKVNSHNTGKLWEKTKNSKVMGFSNILDEAEIHRIPKIWKKWIRTVREKYEKTKTIQKLSVSEIFHLKQKSMQFPKHGKTVFSLYRKNMRKHKHSKVLGFSNILGEAEIHTVPKIWEKWIPIVREKYGKTQTFQSEGFLELFTWSRNPCSSQNMGKVDCHYTGKVWESRNILNLWVS